MMAAMVRRLSMSRVARRGRAVLGVEVRAHGDGLHEAVGLDGGGQFAEAGVAVEVEQGAGVAPVGGDVGHGDLAPLG